MSLLVGKEEMKKIIINISLVIDLCILPISLLNALLSPMIFDAPGSLNNPIAWIILLGCLGYPIIIIASLVLSRRSYKNQQYSRSLFLSAVPFIPLIILGIITAWATFIHT
jgi:hypothetical protein